MIESYHTPPRRGVTEGRFWAKVDAFFRGDKTEAAQRTRKMTSNGQSRADIQPGQVVWIVLKQDQRTGKLTKGIVKDILTKSPTHPHGIKVRLADGRVGRVKEVADE